MCIEITGITHWRQVTHICVGNLTIIGSDNGLSPGRRQAITWTNVGILLIGPLGTNFSEILIEIHTFSFKKIHLKMSSGKCRPFCLGLNVLMEVPISHHLPEWSPIPVCCNVRCSLLFYVQPQPDICPRSQWAVEFYCSACSGGAASNVTSVTEANRQCSTTQTWQNKSLVWYGANIWKNPFITINILFQIFW